MKKKAIAIKERSILRVTGSSVTERGNMETVGEKE